MRILGEGSAASVGAFLPAKGAFGTSRGPLLQQALHHSGPHRAARTGRHDPFATGARNFFVRSDFSLACVSMANVRAIDRTETKQHVNIFHVSAPARSKPLDRPGVVPIPAPENSAWLCVRKQREKRARAARCPGPPRWTGREMVTGVMKCRIKSHFEFSKPRISAVARVVHR